MVMVGFWGSFLGFELLRSRRRSQARQDLQLVNARLLLNLHHGSMAPTQWTTCKQCNMWWWISQMESRDYWCSCGCRVARPKGDMTKGDGNAGKGKGKGKDKDKDKQYRTDGATGSNQKGFAQIATALQTMTSSLATLHCDNKDGIAKQLTSVATALQAAVSSPAQVPKSRALRLAEAARKLEDANKKYKWAFDAKQSADEKAKKATEWLTASADDVLNAEKEIEMIQQEGKEKPKSIFDQLLNADTEMIQPSEIEIAEVEAHFQYDEDMDEEGKRQVELAKKQVLEHLRQTASTFRGQLKDHLQQAKDKAQQERATITQAYKKRKAGSGEPDDILVDGAGAFLEQRRKAQLNDVEYELQKSGFSAVFTEARHNEKSLKGPHGGTAVITKGHLKATSFRHKARADTTSSVTTLQGPCDMDMIDWTPVTLHLKGTSLLIISLYLDPNASLVDGVNARKLTSLAAFLHATSTPWIICGDFNCEFDALEKTGWPTALGATGVVQLPEGQNTSFLGDATPSNIDYALVNPGGQRLVRGIHAVHDVPGKPHVGLVITIKAAAQVNECRRLRMPKASPHPKLPKKANPNSKAAKKKKKAALPVLDESDNLSDGEAAETDTARWEALGPDGCKRNQTGAIADVETSGPVPRRVTQMDSEDIDPFVDLDASLPNTDSNILTPEGGEGAWGSPEAKDTTQKTESTDETMHDPNAATTNSSDLSKETHRTSSLTMQQRIADKAAGVNTTIMDVTWEVAAQLQALESTDTAPEYIKQSAAYKTDLNGAERLGRQHHQLIGTLEKFYCMAYKVDLAGRAVFCGRGHPYDYKTVPLTGGTDWWNRADTVQSTLWKQKHDQKVNHGSARLRKTRAE
ncbi:unnamed protein product [Prorocentrum cordatum]|uniref:Endonuclease/exonuclease/phosphatase domain-containing protein n=1 Tax=Prorocentrum cordatum TaxID=2364126 RepID=A0ABN9SGD7_9DINO|nr:unnamed protein product [Polarella glacialis]